MHERNCRVPTEIVRDLPTSLKASPDPTYLVIYRLARFGGFPRPFRRGNPQHLAFGVLRRGVVGRFGSKSDVIINIIGKSRHPRCMSSLVRVHAEARPS